MRSLQQGDLLQRGWPIRSDWLSRLPNREVLDHAWGDGFWVVHGLWPRQVLLPDRRQLQRSLHVLQRGHLREPNRGVCLSAVHGRLLLHGDRPRRGVHILSHRPVLHGGWGCVQCCLHQLPGWHRLEQRGRVGVPCVPGWVLRIWFWFTHLQRVCFRDIPVGAWHHRMHGLPGRDQINCIVGR
jgi:hypothetical protein